MMKVFYSLALLAAAALSANAAEPVNLLTNPSFANEGEGWQNLVKPDGGVTSYNADGTVTLSVAETWGDNIVSQIPTWEIGKRYVFTVLYNNTNPGNDAFAGLWTRSGETPTWPGNNDHYTDLGSTNGEWMRSTDYLTPADQNWCVIMAANHRNSEISYKEPMLLEVPEITMTVNDAPVAQAVNAGTTIAVVAGEGFDLYYQYGNEEAVAMTDGSFVAAKAGVYTVSVVYQNITLNSASVIVVGDGSANKPNLMADAIPADKTNQAPTEPWYAYNTSINEFGGGNGWQYRNRAGAMNGEGAAEQLFLRWNDTNSVWVYGYKVELTGGVAYNFSVMAATNDNKENSLVVALVSDMADAAEAEGVSFNLNDYNGNCFEGLLCETTFNPETTGEYYVVFKTGNKGGNVIIRTTDYSLKAAPVLMENALAGTVLQAPDTPWFAYNTATNEIGGGNGWQLRNESGANAAEGEPAQLFLRWNTDNSTWVYAYAVNMKKGYKYNLKLKAATNDGKTNSLVIGLTGNMEDVANMATQKFDISEYNGNCFEGLEISCDLVAAVDGINYIVFKSENLSGNVIIRTTGFSLAEDGVADYESVYNDLVSSINDALSALMEKDEAAAEFAFSSSWGLALTDLIYAENIEDYEAAYATLQAAYAAFNEAYPTLVEYFNASQAAMAIVQAADYADGDKVAALSQAATSGYSESATLESLQEAVKNFTQLEREVVESNALCEGLEDAVNMTDKIVNPNNTEGNEGWTVDMLDGSDLSTLGMGSNNNEPATLADGSELKPYFDAWKGDAGWADDFNQTLTLAPGEYRLSVFARAAATEDLTIYEMYAGEESVELPKVGSTGNLFGKGWNQCIVDFQVGEAPAEEDVATRADGNEDVQIGVRACAEGNGIWISFTKFQLVQTKSYGQSGVAEVEAAEGAAEYYDLNGMRVNGKLSQGVYVKRQGSKVSKVLVK